VQAEDFEQLLEKANQDLASSTGMYDVILQYNFALTNYVRNNYILTLDDLTRRFPQAGLNKVGEQLFRNHWEEVGFYYTDPGNPDGGISPFGLPFAANTMLLVMNDRFFESDRYREEFHARYQHDLAAPQTWDDLLKLAAFFTRPEDKTYGICLQGAAGGWLYYEWVNFLFGMGGKTMAKEHGWAGGPDTRLLLDSAESRRAAELYVALRPFNAGDFFTVGAPEQREILLDDRVAMAIVWSDYVPELFERGQSKGIGFAFAPIPGTVSMLAGGSFYINRDSTEVAAAVELVTFLLDTDRQRSLVEQGLCSPVRDAYEGIDETKVPYAAAVATSLRRGVYMLEAGPDADLISLEITTALQQAWRGDLPPGEAIMKAGERISRQRPAIWAATRTSDGGG
jgi:ABC-type glycerol-3-phosphate transport system substrate-binding protein